MWRRLRLGLSDASAHLQQHGHTSFHTTLIGSEHHASGYQVLPGIPVGRREKGNFNDEGKQKCCGFECLTEIEG